MIAQINHLNRSYKINLARPLDISLNLRGDDTNPRAWYVNPPKIEPVRDGGFVGKVSERASVNFNNIEFNPHGHGTHTECVGHITPGFHSINQTLKTFFFTARLFSVEPERKGEDQVISEEQLREKIQENKAEALILRTLPNHPEKQSRKYSNTNWPYLEEKAAVYLRESGIQHLLIDLPSVDKEKDEGKLLAHKAFWNYPEDTRFNATITELVYVRDEIGDGEYLLNLQIASFENDATPSKPVLYKPE